MKKFIVTIAEGIEKITESGVFRKLLLLPENVGIKTCEMGVLMLHPGQEWGFPEHHHADEEAYFVLEGKITASSTRVPVSGGKASVPNIAIHGLVGAGYLF